MSEQLNQSDHDLLITLHEKVTNLIEKVDKLTDDHEARIRSLERWRWIVVGGFSLAITLLTLYVTYHK